MHSEKTNMDSHLGQVLATDLDGTLIPLSNVERNVQDLETLSDQLRANGVLLVYSTGRHFASVEQAMKDFSLPIPEWIICDVGTSIFRRQRATFVSEEAYQQHLAQVVATLPIEELSGRLGGVPGLRLQESEKQGRFKLSFYTDARELENITNHVQSRLDELSAPYSIISSIDPFTNNGLIDLLPRSVSKAYALQWWVRHTGQPSDSIVFAGDSGNDTAALTAGFRSIVVENASRDVAKSVYQIHRQSGWANRLCIAKEKATSGVLEGCRWFGLVDPVMPNAVPLGATPITTNKTFFRVWAPKRVNVSVESDGVTHELERKTNGEFSGFVDGIGPGQIYNYKLDGEICRPDPRARYQPNGVHDDSEVVHAASFPWGDGDWHGVHKRDLVIYELHVGSLTEEGTFLAAIDRIPSWGELGITAIEVMPVAQSPGRWNWGYDGVNLYSPRNSFGRPDDFKGFVDACHQAGIAVILDVVYNHLGPEGNYLGDFGPYFSRKHHTPWGSAFNFDGRQSRPVRDFVIENAIYWLDEFHLDGLRLDAVHFMHDDSDEHILQEIRTAVTGFARTVQRPIHLIAEANVFDEVLLGTGDGTDAYDAIWCDCLMHSIYSHAVPDVKLTTREYHGANDIANALRLGYVYRSKHHHRTQATAETDYVGSHISSLVMALQTHDSVGNHPHGKRLHMLSSKELQKAAAALFLLYPSVPMIFMGEEFAVDVPFTFFADFEDQRLRDAVDKGRAKEYPQHVWDGALLPSDPDAFQKTKLLDGPCRDSEMLQWYRDLIALRRQGIAEGWLAPDNLELNFQPENHIYSLSYHARDSQIVLHSRFAPTAEQGGSANIEPGLNEKILLSSLPPQRVDNQLILQANHAIVLQSK